MVQLFREAVLHRATSHTPKLLAKLADQTLDRSDQKMGSHLLNSWQISHNRLPQVLWWASRSEPERLRS